MKKTLLTRLDEAAEKARSEGHVDYAVLFDDAAHALRAVIDELAAKEAWQRDALESNARIKAYLEEILKNDERQRELVDEFKRNQEVIEAFHTPGMRR